MEYNQIVEKYEKIKIATKNSIDVSNEKQQKISNSTAIAILYIENESDSLKILANKKSNMCKHDIVYYHLYNQLDDFDEKEVRHKIRTVLGYYEFEYFWNRILMLGAGVAVVFLICVINMCKDI